MEDWQIDKAATKHLPYPTNLRKRVKIPLEDCYHAFLIESFSTNDVEEESKKKGGNEKV